jgi:hypothetical protein
VLRLNPKKRKGLSRVSVRVSVDVAWGAVWGFKQGFKQGGLVCQGQCWQQDGYANQ